MCITIDITTLLLPNDTLPTFSPTFNRAFLSRVPGVRVTVLLQFWPRMSPATTSMREPRSATISMRGITGTVSCKKRRHRTS